MIFLLNQILLVGNIYGSKNEKDNKELLDVLNSHIEAAVKHFLVSKMILGGDFNVTMKDEVDRFPSRRKKRSFLVHDDREKTCLDDA